MKLQNKAPGFFVGLVASVLAIAAAICYGVTFPSIVYKEPVFDVTICIILAAAGVISAALLLINNKTAGFGPAVLAVASGISFFMYVRMVIWPVADTIYGIEPFPQFTELVTVAALILGTLIVSEVALYMKKAKAEEA